MSDSYPRLKVITVLAVGLVAFGFAPIFVRFTPETSPLILAAYRTVFAVLLLLPYWFFKKKKLSANTKDSMYTMIAGVCLGFHFICWISSLYYTSVASASVLVTVHPIILILVERFWLKRRFASTTWFGVILAFLGSVFLGVSDSQIRQDFINPLFGNSLAVTAAGIFAIYLLIGQKIRQKRGWIDYVFPVYFFAAATCLISTLIFEGNLLAISFTGIGSAFGMAFFPQILGHGSMNFAIKYVSPTLLSTLILVEPIFATFLAYLFFDEVPPLTSFGAMAIIIIGVGLTCKRNG